MSRKVNTAAIEDWMAANSPQAMEKLSIAAGLSIKVIHMARNGLGPVRDTTCIKLARGLGLDVEAVFPGFKRDKSA